VSTQRTLAFLLGIVVLGAIALPIVYDTEKQPLDDSVRSQVAGQFIELTRGVTHYQLAGPAQGRSIVLVHGFSVPYYIWDPTFEALVDAGYRVLRYDLFGRGYSDRPDVNYDGRLFQQQLDELLERLGIALPVDLIGLSMGGAIVVDYAARHPDRVHSLVLIDPAHQGREARTLMDLPLVGEYLMAVRMAPGMAASQLSDFVHPELFPDWPARYRIQMQYPGFRRAILSTLRHYFHEDHWAAYETVGALNKPVLLIWGREDTTIPFSQSKQVQETLGASLLAIGGAGHIPQYEKPEVVNSELLRFLEELD